MASKQLELIKFVQEDCQPTVHHGNGQSYLMILDDGSAHPTEGLGAAAIKLGTDQKQSAFLGLPGTVSNFEWELVGITLGLEMGRDFHFKRPIKRIIILTNKSGCHWPDMESRSKAHFWPVPSSSNTRSSQGHPPTYLNHLTMVPEACGNTGQ
jgi:hypothetical protein